MSKNISIEYTNPVTRAQTTIQVTVDVERYRKDTELGAVENFFLKATASGASPDLINIDALIADILDGRPSHAKKNVVQSLVSEGFSSGGTTLSVIPPANTAGFVEDVPCVLLDKYGSVKGYFIPTTVEADLTIPAANEGALAVDAEIGWIVQQLQPFVSPLGENSQLGIKAQLEKPTTPTGVTGAGSVGAGINAGYTKPSDAVIAFYDIYCIKADTVPASIEPNSLPSVANRASSLGSTGVNLTQYFDQTDMELKALDAGTYFIGVVAKDGTGMVDVNESAIGWSAAVTIS